MQLYNGPRSGLMDKLCDAIAQHTDLSSYDDWPILSLYLAREIKKIEVGMIEVRPDGHKKYTQMTKDPMW